MVLNDIRKQPFLRLAVLFILVAALFFFPGCGEETGEITEIEAEEQKEFIAWARPLWQHIDKSDQAWLHMSRTMVFYTDEEEKASRDELESIAADSIKLHEELIDYFSDTAGSGDEKKLLQDLSRELCQARLEASEYIVECLQKDEMPDARSEYFAAVQKKARALGAEFESIMKGYDVVWAHLRYFEDKPQ